MTEIAYYVMDLIHMNVVMGRYFKALIHKKEEVFDYLSYFFLVAPRPNAGHGLLILEVSTSHTTTHHSR